MLALGATAKVLGIAAALQLATLTGWWLHVGSVRAANTQTATDLGACTAARDSAVTANEEWEAATLDAHRALSQCQAQWAEVKADAEFHKAAAAEHRRNAVRWAEAFAGRYAGKTQQCAAALQALDPACPELEGY
jgi:hypothetical protein